MPTQEWGELFAASTIARKEADRALARRGLTVPQASVLGLLDTSGPMSITGIARMLMQESQSTTTLIDRMCAKGLVERVNGPGRRRAVLVKLSEKGERISETLRTTAPAFTERMFGVLSQRDRVTLAKILQRFNERNLERLHWEGDEAQRVIAEGRSNT